MRVAMIVVSILMIATPSNASDSCMTKAEARRHFGSVHIYWHGPDHCWDSTPGRHQWVRRAGRRDRELVQPQTDPSGWRDSMSEMLPDSERVREPNTQDSWNNRSTAAAVAPAEASWTDRWVDIVQVAPTLASEAMPEVASAIGIQSEEPMVKPYVVLMFVFVGAVLTIACAAIITPS